MVDLPNQNIKTRKGGGAQVLAAWLTIPALALLLLFVTSFVTGLVAVDVDYADMGDTLRFFAINGFVGVIVVSLLILSFFRFRRVRYVFHVLIGLWIGVGLYAAMFLSSGAVYVVYNNMDSDGWYGEGYEVCTNPTDQYRRYGSAIIPIATNLGSGSGFLIDGQGTILTAHHVIRGASKVYANYIDGERVLRVVKTAPEYDLALLRIDKVEATPMPISESYSNGDEVLAYGYPGNSLDGGPPSVTGGIVSRVLNIDDLRITDKSFPDYLEVIQTDAAINPGNSGGALIGPCGAIGVVVAMSDSAKLGDYIGIASEQGIGYAVSVKTVKKVFGI